ncbi:uncharacterized protein Elys isoform X2 [Panulirus ornatus]|uniref:uncharacterized protein Elys isoform X2 n=1 Tax=Panulirus ornatus TaxID=150431 RepID=UPI003A83E554
MVGVSVVQVGSAVRHTPLAPLSHETDPTLNSEDSHKDLRNSTSQFPVLGGFVGGGQLAWRAFGPTVEVIEPNTGTRKAAWTFGAILHNAGARVTSVCGVGPGTVSQVVVGVDLGADRKPQGMVALLCLYSSRLTRVFHFTHKVTSLCMVSGGEVSVDSGTLAPELRPWHGLLVVGTAHGTLHLLDLALDLGGHKVLSDEVSPGNLIGVVTPDPQAERSRITAVMQHCHPSMCLSDGMSYGGRFHLIGPDDNILFETSSHLVTITALTFIPQLASLIVGYNFGAFQIINLSSLTIDCTSPFEDKMPPVYSFACQEPENDPKNFVYLWLCRSWGPAERSRENKTGRENNSHALCTMYAMNYDNKVWIEGHGLWYQGLASISPRFEFDAIGGLGLLGQPAKPSVVFAAMTVRQTTPNSAATSGGSSSVSALATPDEDSGPVPEQSLCLFGWVGGILENGTISINHYLAVFDINQWYQAQMPSTMKLEENHLCPYMSFHKLDRVPGGNTNEGPSEIVLGAAPKPASWARHMSHTCNDSDWFPAALSYDAHVLTSEGLMEYRCQSAQQAALTHLTSCGPSAIVSPEDAYAMCVFAGLISSDAHPTTTGSCMVIEREALLNVALDQQLVSLLVQCVAEFSEGRFTNLGCSLPSLLEWAWSRVCTIKTTNDNQCLPLFDPDCGVMSAESIAILHQNLTSLASLTTIITAIRDYANTNMITLQGAGELESRVQVVGLLMLHLSVVLWFYHCGLLSHTPTEDVIEDCHVPFPADLLCRIYKNRRSEIQRLSSVLAGNEVLMIDGLLEDTAGSSGSIGKAWEKEGGCGMYPPPSLHALLAVFLLPDVSTTTKHRIVQYLFLDLASLLSDGYVRVVEELVKYPSSFSLSPSHIKLTQAFWLLDHKDFQEGLNVLLDPLVNTNDITPWQHRRIMKAFLYQGEHSRALTYAQIRQPPKVDMDDIRLHLTLLLANGLIREAFHYQRSHRIKNNSEDLLNHLFTGCEQLGKLESVVHLPLSHFEEEALVSYLHASSNPSAQDYLLVYYLQRARYDEAALLQDSLRGGLGTAKKRQGARSALVHGYLTHLPDVAKRLTSGVIRKNGPTHSIYTKPQPLSAQIRQAVSSPTSHASSINKMLEHNQEAWPSKWGSTTPYTPFRNKTQRRKTHEPVEPEEFSDLFTPKRKNLREASHVVFPSRVQALHSKYTAEEDGEVGLFSPAAKKSRFGESSLMRDDVSKLMESVLRRSIYGGMGVDTSVTMNISSDLMSLLQTPKIMRKRKSEVHPSTESSLVDTPQSILKVRQMVQRPLSPSPASETSIPVFPRLSTKKASISEDALPSRTSDTSMTPKQLRFHLPKMRLDEDLVKEQAEGKDEVMLIDNQYVPEEVVTEKNVEEDIEMIEYEEDVEELEDEVRGGEVENEGKKEDMIKILEAVHDIDESEKQCDQELEDEEETELEEKETERERDLLLKNEQTVVISPCPDIDINSNNPLRNPDSGMPTPRQPLRGYVAKRDSVAAVLHQSDLEECTDGVGMEEAEGEEEEHSLEYISRDTTMNETYYSFNEEESSKVEESVDRYITEDEDEELKGAERSKEVGDSDDDIVFLDDDKEKEKRIVYIDEVCPKEKECDESKSQKEEDSQYEGLYDDMDEELETETSGTFNQETKKMCESTSLQEGHTLNDFDEKSDNLPSSEVCLENTEHSLKEMADSISNGEGIETERNSEDESEVSANESEIIKVLEFSESEPEELEVKENLASKEEEYDREEKHGKTVKGKEALGNVLNIPQSECEEKLEEEPKLSLNESEIISPLEFSESESEPEILDTVKEKLISTERDHSKEEEDTVDQELTTKDQQPVLEDLKIPSDEEESTKEEIQLIAKEELTTKEAGSENILSTIADELPSSEEPKLATEEELIKNRELVFMKELSPTEGSSATIEEEVKHLPLSDEYNEENERLVDKNIVMADVVESSGEYILNEDCRITEEEEEMITDTVSEEELCVSHETSEHFSPLHFSDSESESEVEHDSSSETKSPHKEISSPLNEYQDIKMPESSNYEIMEVDDGGEQSLEGGSGDVPEVLNIEQGAASLGSGTLKAVFSGQDENSGRIKLSIAEEKSSIPSEHEDLEAPELEKVINQSEEVENVGSNISCVVKIAESKVTFKGSKVIETGILTITHETETSEGNKSSRGDSCISKSEEASPGKMDDEEMLHSEHQKTRALEQEELVERLYVQNNSDDIHLVNYDNEMGVLERIDTGLVVPRTDDESKEKMKTEISDNEMLKNQGYDKELLKNQGENVFLETEGKKVDLEKKITELEYQVLPESSTRDEEEETSSFQIDSLQQQTKTVIEEQEDDFTAAPPRKRARSTPLTEVPDEPLGEDTKSVSPKSLGWKKSSGTPPKVFEELPVAVLPRESSRQISSIEAGTTVFEESALTMSPKRSIEFYISGDKPHAVAEESTAGTSTTGTEETTLTVSCRSEQINVTDPLSRADEETATTSLLMRSSPQRDSADIISIPAKQDTKVASPQQNVKNPLMDIPGKSVEDISLVTSQLRSLRHTDASDLQTTTDDDTVKMPETSKATPLRRSQRLRAASPHTPGTPKKTRKIISTTEVTTPVRSSSQELVDEMITRSGRKIRLVPVPVTKSKSLATGSSLVTPTRSSVGESVATEDMQKVSQKLELTFDIAEHSASSPTLEYHSVISPSTSDVLATPPGSPANSKQTTNETSLVVTPGRLSRRRSTRQSTSDEALETIEEEGEKTTSPKTSDSDIRARTPTKKTPSKSTPTKVTPRRTRRSSRQSMTSDGLETIAEDSELSTEVKQIISDIPQTLTPQKTHHSLDMEVSSDIRRRQTTSRRRRQSVSGDIAETPERKTPRRRRHSCSGDITDDVKQRETPVKEGTSPLGSVFYKVESKTPSKGETSSLVTDVRRSARKQRQLSHSEEDRPKMEESQATSVKTNLLTSLEVFQNSPSRRTTRSSGSSSVTSMKDSESSEEDDRLRKRHLSRRVSGGSTMPHSSLEEQVSRRRKSHRLSLPSKLSTTSQLQLQGLSGKPSRKSLKSLKMHSESDENTSLLTPGSDLRGHSLGSKMSDVGSSSVLLIEGANEDEGTILQHGFDTSRDADDEAKYSEVQESPDLPLNLIEVDGKGKKKRKSSISLLSVGQGGKKRTILPKRRLQSLKIHTQPCQDQEDLVLTTTRRTQRYKRRASSTTLFGMETEEKNQEVEIRTPEKEVEEEEEDEIVIEKEGGSVVLEMKKVKERKDENVEKKLDATETERALDKEENLAEEDSKESLTPQFEFSKPKPVTSSRRVRALEYLTSEAVEFLFSPPQAAGRIVRHHAKVEEEAKTSSSESEAESETGKKSTHRRHK